MRRFAVGVEAPRVTLKLNRGVPAVQVESITPAGQFGVQGGDIITAVDGVQVKEERSMALLPSLRDSMRDPREDGGGGHDVPSSSTRRPARLWSTGVVPYEAAWRLQRRLVEDRLAGQGVDTVLLLEHPPTFTMGRRTLEAHWGGDESSMSRDGFSVYRIERGGSVTYHGPGQVVGYPILCLQDYCAGPKAYMGRLEEVLIRTLADWDIRGYRGAGLPGVWVGDPPAKIAAMGTHIRRGVTMHGFALNVTVDLMPFQRIVPCGIAGCHVTNMTELLGSAPESAQVTRRLADHLAQVFQMHW
ncbi:MAG: lipoyl(octanoyl) transferase LipB, partial [Nitrospira sp.]